MARVVQDLPGLRFPHDRVALWAHNGHIAKNGADAYFGTDMGTYLAADLGHKYQAIGLGARETYLGLGAGLPLRALSVPGRPGARSRGSSTT